MRADKALVALIVVWVGLWVSPAFPATPVQDDCDWDKVQQVDATTLLHPKLFFEAQKPLMNSNRWLDVLRGVQADFESSTVVPHDENYRRFDRELAATVKQFEEVTSHPDFENLLKTAQNVKLARFHIVRDPDEDKVDLFRDTKEDRITITAAMPPQVRREYCWRAISLNRILTQYGESARATTALALQTYVAQWDAYNANGYLQYPWELYLNGKWTFDAKSLAPPKRQLVIAHPGIAVEQSGPSFEGSRLDEVVSVEPIGFLWYGDDRKMYYGFSTLLTFSSSRDVGRGLLLHFGKLAKLGYVWRDRDAQNRRQNGVVFSMDLYQMLAGPPSSQVDARDRAQSVLEGLLAKP
jgi:hypothetical protein